MRPDVNRRARVYGEERTNSAENQAIEGTSRITSHYQITDMIKEVEGKDIKGYGCVWRRVGEDSEATSGGVDISSGPLRLLIKGLPVYPTPTAEDASFSREGASVR